jgi:hypothetical protein
VTQEEVELIYRPPDMNLALSWPTVLNTVFVTLFFSPGLPLLLPIALAAMFVTYWVERFMAFRVYAAPPLTTDALARLSLTLLVLAIPLNLVIATWMLGADGTLASAESSGTVPVGDELPAQAPAVDASSAERFFGSVGDGIEWVYGSVLTGLDPQQTWGLTRRARKAYIVPLLMFAILSIVFLVLYYVVGRWLWGLAKRLINFLTCGRYCGAAVAASALASDPEDDDQRAILSARLLPPFTSKYEVKLPVGPRHYVSEQEYVAGWRIRKDGSRGQGAEKKVKVFVDEDLDDPVRPHHAGDAMLTYEVISDYSISSYDIRAHPDYRDAALALHAGISQLSMQRAMAAERQRRALELQQRRNQVQMRENVAASVEEDTKRGDKDSVDNEPAVDQNNDLEAGHHVRSDDLPSLADPGAGAGVTRAPAWIGSWTKSNKAKIVPTVE